MRTRAVIFTVLLGLLLSYGWVMGIRVTPASAAALTGPGVTQVRLVGEVPTRFGKSVAFEAVNGTFGVAQLQRTFGFLWMNLGGSSGHSVKQGRPFRAAGFALGSDRGTDQFVVGVKVADAAITVVSIGIKDQSVENAWHPSELSLGTVKARPDLYTVAPVIDGFAVLVAPEYNASSWTIRAFNDDGTLVADQLPGAGPRWLVKPAK